MGIECPKCHFDNPDDTLYCGKCATSLPSSKEIPVTETLETPTEELTTGSTFAGRYQIIEELGKGGMGKVYRVLDKELKEEVALKLIKPEIASDKKTLERFSNELKLARKISHKNVGRMYELMEEKGTRYITMEYVPGEDLKGMIRMMGQLGAGKSISIAKQLCEGLAEAHRLGVIHRDLKPSNIMIDKDGNARILDFGIARSLKAKGITRAGVMIGTPEYMSPEQAEVKEVDQRSDIYSLGVILYEMATGRVPFEGETPLGIAMKHKSEVPKDPRELNSQIPVGLSRVILKCMEKNKEKRYQSASELRSELTNIEKAIPTPEKVVPKRKPITSKEITVQFNLKKLLLPALIVIALLIMAGYFIFRSDSEIVDIKIGQTKQLTRAPGIEIDTAISPDGKLIAYTKGPVGQFHIHVRQIAGGRTISLTKDMPGQQRWPIWSSDGTRIAFQSERAIYVIPALGGIPKQLVKSPNQEKVTSVAWSPDGRQIVFAHGNSIYTRSVDKGEPKKITEAFEPHSLNWSPDGTKIAYVSGNLNYISRIHNIAPSSIWVVSLKAGDAVQITDNEYMNLNPIWMPTGRHLLFISNQGGSFDIYQAPLSRSGKPSGKHIRLTSGLNAQSISLSKDGMNLAYSVLTYNANIWTIRIPEKEPFSISEVRPLTTGNQVIEAIGGVSPDGQWLLFDSNLSGNQDIYKMPITGGEPLQLTTHPSDDFLPRWSPDGTEIAFHSFRTGNRDIFVISADGGSIQQITSDPAQDRRPDWSLDGNRLVFRSDRTGRYELYVISREKRDSAWGTPRQLTFDGGTLHRWSPDGRLIVYTSGNSLRVISPEGGDPHELVRGPDIVRTTPGWFQDGQTIYFYTFGEKWSAGIWSVSALGGAPKLLIRFDNPALIPDREIETDSKSFFLRIVEFVSDIWMMELLKYE